VDDGPHAVDNSAKPVHDTVDSLVNNPSDLSPNRP